ncbi:hypothetical protein LV84_02473 [Algoriphagus ratkowskyi]|uniref:Lipocalin-like protein n=1 Tax=Algoriphagus ratkowskyi TaxID=57028 RepID=A0A2W7RWQ6_9BACT|nr:hypothetical protein [Algoriphagus ratkowskyi]PZX55335.1 hypothetical protein LV84_02473 [Algoriphagus ratkowskyi]TXD79734.1 hypothetical protein ESW18_00970 [Algoriphagus ratkowskyi]
MNFKAILFFVLCLGYIIPAKGQSKNCTNQHTKLIGTWEYVDLSDSLGAKIDTIWHEVVKGYEIPKGPQASFQSEGMYTMQFTKENIDRGIWCYDSDNSRIIRKLYYQTPYSASAKYLIANGHAIQDEKGDYYEVQMDSVIKLTRKSLILSEENNRQRRFRKIR